MPDKIRIAGIVKESIVDGPGLRLVVFSQGCLHNCPGCHNPETHSFEGGKMVDAGYIIDLVKKNPLLDGVTLSGGEPFEQAEVLSVLAARIKAMGLNIVTYTGYTYEYITKNPGSRAGWPELLNQTDILVDGRFELARKNLLLKFRGSENQRVIDVKKSSLGNGIVLIA